MYNQTKFNCFCISSLHETSQLSHPRVFHVGCREYPVEIPRRGNGQMYCRFHMVLTWYWNVAEKTSKRRGRNVE
jgi:hypothetical protein